MKRGRAYERFVRPLLFALDPETAHHFALRVLRAGGTHLPLRQFQPKPKPTTVFGITFPNPVGLAAGFDKNGVALPAWAALGFGFVEIGTVTAKAATGKSAAAHLSFSGAGSADQSTRLQQRRRGDGCAKVAAIARFRTLAANSHRHQHREIESNAIGSCG